MLYLQVGESIKHAHPLIIVPEALGAFILIHTHDSSCFITVSVWHLLPQSPDWVIDRAPKHRADRDRTAPSHNWVHLRPNSISKTPKLERQPTKPWRPARYKHDGSLLAASNRARQGCVEPQNIQVYSGAPEQYLREGIIDPFWRTGITELSLSPNTCSNGLVPESTCAFCPAASIAAQPGAWDSAHWSPYISATCRVSPRACGFAQRHFCAPARPPSEEYPFTNRS